MKLSLLAVLSVLLVLPMLATSPSDRLPLFRGGEWSFQSSSAPLGVLRVVDDYPPCDVVEDFCNHTCAGTRNELGCFMNCMWENSCPVGLSQVAPPTRKPVQPESLSSSYVGQVSRAR